MSLHKVNNSSQESSTLFEGISVNGVGSGHDSGSQGLLYEEPNRSATSFRASVAALPNIQDTVTLPDLSHVPLLTGKQNFDRWDSTIRTTIGSLGMITHIHDRSLTRVLKVFKNKEPELGPGPNPTSHELAACKIWQRDDQTVLRILLSRLSPDLKNVYSKSLDVTAKMLYRALHRRFYDSTRNWNAGKTIWNDILQTPYVMGQTLDYCNRWRNAVSKIQATRYHLPSSIAVDAFFQKIPDAITPFTVVKTTWYLGVDKCDNNDPYEFHDVVDSIETLAHSFHNRPILFAQDTAPVSR